MLKGEEGGVPVVWLGKVVVLLRSTGGRGGEDRKSTFLQYVAVSAPLDATGKNLGCFCVMRSTSEDM